MKLLTNKQQECENSKICYICKEDFEDKCSEDHCHYTGKYRGVHIVYVIWNIVCKKIPIVFHNGSNYDYLIIKEPAEEFKWIGRKGEEITKIISYKSHFTDSARFMANFAEGIHKIKRKYRHGDKKYEACGIKCKDCQCCLEYRCLCCNRNYQKKINEHLKKQFSNTYRFSCHGINKFILLLQKGVFPFEYMDDCEKCKVMLLLEKDDFYLMQIMCMSKDFKIKSIGEYHDLYGKQPLIRPK